MLCEYTLISRMACWKIPHSVRWFRQMKIRRDFPLPCLIARSYGSFGGDLWWTPKVGHVWWSQPLSQVPWWLAMFIKFENIWISTWIEILTKMWWLSLDVVNPIINLLLDMAFANDFWEYSGRFMIGFTALLGYQSFPPNPSSLLLWGSRWWHQMSRVGRPSWRGGRWLMLKTRYTTQTSILNV